MGFLSRRKFQRPHQYYECRLYGRSFGLPEWIERGLGDVLSIILLFDQKIVPEEL